MVYNMVCKLENLHAIFLWLKEDEIIQNLKLLDYTLYELKENSLLLDICCK